MVLLVAISLGFIAVGCCCLCQLVVGCIHSYQRRRIHCRRRQGEVYYKDMLIQGIKKLKIHLGACHRRIAIRAVGEANTCSQRAVIVVDE